MKLQYQDKEGWHEKELTQQELESEAARGNRQAKRELAAQRIGTLPAGEIKAILELLV